MKTRPKSIAIISWFLIIISVISIIAAVFTYDSPEALKAMELSVLPIGIQYTLMVIGTLLTVTCGILMLKGHIMGRNIYIGWTVISLILSFFTSPAKTMVIPGLILFAIFSFFLFRPKANEYFSTAKKGVNSDS